MYNDDHYYRGLAVMDKLKQYLDDNGISYYKLSQLYSNKETNFGMFTDVFATCRQVKECTLNKICEILNINILYFLCDRKPTRYIETHLDLDKIYKYYKEMSYKKRAPNSIVVIMSKIKNKQTKSLQLKTIFFLEEYLKVPCYRFYTNSDELLEG